MRRPVPKSMEDVCRGARRIVVIDGVVDTTNIGAIFRSAAALGMDAVLLTRNSCDPLNRRAVRVSMGTVFLCRGRGWTVLWIRSVSWVPHGGHGAYGQFHFHRQSRFEDRAPVGYCDGY